MHCHTRTPGGLPPGRVVLSQRAKARLRIAAAFLRKRGHTFQGEDFYQQVLDVINSLPADARLELRDLVDWVEEYNKMR